MDILSKDVTSMFFRKAIRKDNKAVSMDGEMIRLLMAVDENKTISRIGEEIGMNTAVLKETISKLVRMGIVEPVTKKTNFLSNAFLNEVTVNLTHAIGPMSEFLIEENVSAMGFAINEIPLNSAPELITKIAEGIPDDQTRANFKKKMVEIMPKERI
jgi:DNA-binding MarR family transcriptional regulator